MHINYNSLTRTLEIRDGLGTVYLVLKSVLILNLINALIFTVYMEEPDVTPLKIVWILVAVLSLGVFFYLIFRKSSATEIQAERVRFFGSRTRFGTRRYFLKLQGGKIRDLGKLSDPDDLTKLLEIMDRAGIPSRVSSVDQPTG